MSELDGRSWQQVVNQPAVQWERPPLWVRLRGGPVNLRLASVLVYDGDVDDVVRLVPVLELAVRKAERWGWPGAVAVEAYRVPEMLGWRVHLWHAEFQECEPGMVVVPLWDRGPGGGGA